jgi:prepilin-type N-terminal cleavage/methylation domain-containing protein
MLTRDRRQGFTLIEVIVALVILSTAILGLGASASRLTMATSSAEIRAAALESVEDQIARIRLDPRYADLDSLYAGVESNVLGIGSYTRTTTVVHVQQGSPVTLDYKRISVVVSGPQLTPSISRQIVVAAP